MSYYNNVHITNIISSFQAVAEFLMQRSAPESEIYRICQGWTDKSVAHNLKNIQSKVSLEASLQLSDITNALYHMEPVLAFEALTSPQHKDIYHAIAMWDGFKPMTFKENTNLQAEVKTYIAQQADRYDAILKAMQKPQNDEFLVDILNSDQECMDRFGQTPDDLSQSLRVFKRLYNTALGTNIGHFHDERPLSELRALFNSQAIARADIPFDAKYLDAEIKLKFQKHCIHKESQAILKTLADVPKRRPLKRM